MAQIDRQILIPAPGFASEIVALHVAHLDELTAYLFDDLEGIGPAELERQHAPGHNTIGMLLTHMAVVEVYWVQIGMLGMETDDVTPALGLGIDDDGMPIPAGGTPPALLAGRDLDGYRETLTRARRYSYEHLRGVRDSDLDTVRGRTRRDGTRREFNTRWVLFHMVEHFSGHYGQILLLRHLHRDAGAAP